LPQLTRLTRAAQPDDYSRGAQSHRICRLRTAPTVVGIVDIAGHFQTRQKLNIACETADCHGAKAAPLVAASKLRPRLLKRPKGHTFVTRAAIKFAVDPPSNRHSLTISNFGTASEMAAGETVAMTTIGR
jgi:hypothetical protein